MFKLPLLATLGLGAVGAVGVGYGLPIVHTMYEQHMADSALKDIAVAYGVDVRDAHNKHSIAVAEADAAERSALTLARQQRDSAIEEIHATYPRAQLPRTVAVADKSAL